MMETITSVIDPMMLLACGAMVVVGVTALKHALGKRQGAGTERGSAGWADRKEFESLLVALDEPPAPGAVMLGPSPWSKRRRIDLPRELANRHAVVFGPPGSGKSRGLFLWNCAHYRGSFIAADPKTEAWELTSGFRKKPVRFAPRDPDQTTAFNWIPLCGRDAHLCLSLARAVVTSEEGKGVPFFVRADTAFLASLFAHAASFREPTPATCYDFLTSRPGDTLLNELLGSPNQIARQYATIFSQAKPELRGSIVIGCGVALAWLADARVRRFTSSTRHPPDFGKLWREEISVYWCLDEKDVAVLKPLSTLFFTCVLQQIKEAEGDVPIHLFLDEFANIGRVPNFETEVAVLRGRGVGMTLGFQSVSQGEMVYGKAGAQVIFDSINTKVVLAGLDYDSAETVSRALGEATATEERVSHSTKGVAFFGDRTVTRSKVAYPRSLLTADEVRRIGEREQIVITTNKRPVRTGRFWYSAPPHTARAPSAGEARTMSFAPMDGVIDRGADDVPEMPEDLMSSVVGGEP